MNQKSDHKHDFVSVIIPCRNEGSFIGKVLDNVLSQDYPKERLEVFVVDGVSDDSTPDIIKSYAHDHDHIHFLSNPKKVVPFALNKAISKAKGSIILRMDAHSVYPDDYISSLVQGLTDYNCDNTGGVWITEPANDSLKAKAIADSTSHPFGIGNAHYRLDIQSPKKVDTVPFGCYKRGVFDRIGMFDEELVRNQDDEFNARLIKNGGQIFLLPHVKIRYFARNSFKKTSKMFYQYGLYKPLVNLKVGKPATVRQFAPPLFTLFLVIFLISGILQAWYFIPLAIVMGVYLFIDLLVSIKIASSKSQRFGVFPYLLIVFPLIHVSYGWGYLTGIFRFMLFRKPIHPSKMNENR